VCGGGVDAYSDVGFYEGVEVVGSCGGEGSVVFVGSLEVFCGFF